MAKTATRADMTVSVIPDHTCSEGNGTSVIDLATNVRTWTTCLRCWRQAQDAVVRNAMQGQPVAESPCEYCGFTHRAAKWCPRIKRIVFDPSGAVAEIEFIAFEDFDNWLLTCARKESAEKAAG